MHRLLIIGAGSVGERHLRCAQRTGRAELLLCEPNCDLRNRIAQQYGVREVHSDLDAAIAAQPTAAVICAPTHLHVAMATRLVDAGIHVLVEKPLGTSLEGIDKLQVLVTERNVIASVAYVNRANPSLAKMRQALSSGQFGRPLQLVAVSGQDFAHLRPAYRSTYYARRATGGGAIQDALTHILNSAEWLIGPIESVQADAAHQRILGVDVEDTAHVIARHGNIPACYAINQYQAPNEVTITVACEHGTARFEQHANRWRWMTNSAEWEWNDEPGDALERDELFVSQFAAFFDAVETGGKPLCTLAEGLQTLRVNLAILQSLKEERWTKINLQ